MNTRRGVMLSIACAALAYAGCQPRSALNLARCVSFIGPEQMLTREEIVALKSLIKEFLASTTLPLIDERARGLEFRSPNYEEGTIVFSGHPAILSYHTRGEALGLAEQAVIARIVELETTAKAKGYNVMSCKEFDPDFVSSYFP